MKLRKVEKLPVALAVLLIISLKLGALELPEITAVEKSELALPPEIFLNGHPPSIL